MTTDLIEVLNENEIQMILRLAREAHRKAARNAERNRETGLVDRLPGRDADAVREHELSLLIEKVESHVEDSLPDSFLSGVASQPVRSEDPSRDMIPRIGHLESERDAAEALADQRGALLASLMRADVIEESDAGREFVQRVREHLLVTGEISADA